jgi:hypothetical protein
MKVQRIEDSAFAANSFRTIQVLSITDFIQHQKEGKAIEFTSLIVNRSVLIKKIMREASLVYV